MVEWTCPIATGADFTGREGTKFALERGMRQNQIRSQQISYGNEPDVKVAILL